MRCTNPSHVWIPNPDAVARLKSGHRIGKVSDTMVQFRKPQDADFYYRESLIPCGKCLGCCLDKRDAWAVRASCELAYHDQACFVTLTYSDEFLPRCGENGNPTLRRDHLQDFLKRLRRRLEPKKIRFFGCGEYGSQYDRPHYHLIVFGWMPDDLYDVSPSLTYFRSHLLEEVWTYGFSSVAPADTGAIRYVAGYAAKKYGSTPPDGVLANFVACSLKPAIGYEWFRDYGRSLVRFDASQGFFLAKSELHLLDGSVHTVPQTMLRWWRSAFPDLDIKRSWAKARDPTNSVDTEEMFARAEFQRVLSDRAQLKSINHV